MSQRRRTGWEEGPGSTATQSVQSTSSQIIGNGLAVLQDGITLVRTRGYVRLVITSGDVALSGFSGAFGICVVTNDAFAIGVTAVPTPLDDVDWDGWLWHTLFVLHLPAAFAATDGVVAVKDIEIDSKAMRKIGINDTIALVGEFVEVPVSIMSVRADTRILAKLP